MIYYGLMLYDGEGDEIEREVASYYLSKAFIAMNKDLLKKCRYIIEYPYQ